MAKYVHNNNSIECNSAEIISRKITPGNFVSIKHIGRLFTYKCDRNSEAIIKRELDPKKPIYNFNSHLDEGVKLECEKLYLMVLSKKPYSKDVINHTHRHKAETITTDNFTFAKISQQLKNIPLLDPEKEIILLAE